MSNSTTWPSLLHCGVRAALDHRRSHQRAGDALSRAEYGTSSLSSFRGVAPLALHGCSSRFEAVPCRCEGDEPDALRVGICPATFVDHFIAHKQPALIDKTIAARGNQPAGAVGERGHLRPG